MLKQSASAVLKIREAYLVKRHWFFDLPGLSPVTRHFSRKVWTSKL
jgi:hypothetical protein